MPDAWLQDVALAWRRLRKSPAFTLVTVLTLTLGIGANIAIFSLLYALIFRDLAVRLCGNAGDELRSSEVDQASSAPSPVRRCARTYLEIIPIVPSHVSTS